MLATWLLSVKGVAGQRKGKLNYASIRLKDNLFNVTKTGYLLGD